MIHFVPNNTVTERQLKSALQILGDPNRWCKVYLRKGDAYCVNGALYAAGLPRFNVPREHVSGHPNYVRGDLLRGELQEPFWFLRSALCMFSDYRNVGLFNDAPETEHHQVLMLISLAIKLVQAENEKETNTLQKAA
ncbi:hypothetical protein GN286_14220 [Rhodobacteraceae bacterium IMCC15231]|nr:hypothetical protein [Rhodobacteraceae bacterium IMCC15231]